MLKEAIPAVRGPADRAAGSTGVPVCAQPETANSRQATAKGRQRGAKRGMGWSLCRDEVPLSGLSVSIPLNRGLPDMRKRSFPAWACLALALAGCDWVEEQKEEARRQRVETAFVESLASTPAGTVREVLD